MKNFILLAAIFFSIPVVSADLASQEVAFCAVPTNQCRYLYSPSLHKGVIQIFNLQNNQVKLAEILRGLHQQVPNITRLYLRNNQLTALPAEIGALTALTRLYLSNNQLTALPAEIGALTALTTLYLRDNQLTVLPAEIGALRALTTLNLSNNQLTALPAEIGALTALTSLDLKQNGLTQLQLPNAMINRSHELAFIVPRTLEVLANVANRCTLYFEAEDVTQRPSQAGAIAVVGQEALTAERERVIENWHATVAAHSDILARLLPHTGELAAAQFPLIFQELHTFLERKMATYNEGKEGSFCSLDTKENQAALLAFSRVTAAGRSTFFEKHPTFSQYYELHLLRQSNFCWNTALRGLRLLNGDKLLPHHRISNRESYRTWHYQGMPENLQLVVFAYQLAMEESVETLSQLVRTYLGEEYRGEGQMASFCHMFSTFTQSDMGQVLASPDGELFVTDLARIILGNFEEAQSAAIITLGSLKNPNNLAQKIGLSRKEARLKPLVEALMMTMRGHNKNLTRVEEPDAPACSEGSYLHILNAISEMMRNIGWQSQLPVEIQPCE